MAVGDAISSPSTPISYFAPTTISALNSYSLSPMSVTISSTSVYAMLPSVSGIYPFMDVGGPGIPGGTTVLAINPGGCAAPCVQLNMMPTLSTTEQVTFGGNFTITLPTGVTASGTSPASAPASLSVLTGRYRLIGALFTDASGNLVPFNQDDDTFYLTPSIADIPITGSTCATIGTTKLACALSVPCGRNAMCPSPGLRVQAFGRMVIATTAKVLASSPDQSQPAPSAFGAAPGYTTQDAASATAFPFLLYTDTTGDIDVQSSIASTTVQEVTDGWVFKRSP